MVVGKQRLRLHDAYIYIVQYYTYCTPHISTTRTLYQHCSNAYSWCTHFSVGYLKVNASAPSSLLIIYRIIWRNYLLQVLTSEREQCVVYISSILIARVIDLIDLGARSFTNMHYRSLLYSIALVNSWKIMNTTWIDEKRNGIFCVGTYNIAVIVFALILYVVFADPLYKKLVVYWEILLVICT